MSVFNFIALITYILGCLYIWLMTAPESEDPLTVFTLVMVCLYIVGSILVHSNAFM